MFDILNDMLSKMSAGDRFGGGPSAAPPRSQEHGWSPAVLPGVTGGAAPGVLSPTAQTIVDDPEEEYHQRRAASDARYGEGSPFQRAMARFRGEPAAAPEPRPEPGGAPKQARSISEIIDEVLASSRKPAAAPAPAPAPAEEKPYTGLSPEEEYRQRQAAMQARPQPFLDRALARHRGEAVEEMPITPELGAPKQQQARDPLAIIDEVLASSRKPAAAPAPAPAPAKEKPYTGLSPEEEYHQRRAAMDARDQPHLQRALAAHAARKAGHGA